MPVCWLKKRKKLIVTRYNPETDSAPRTQEYEVSYDDDTRVLDALHEIKDTEDVQLIKRFALSRCTTWRKASSFSAINSRSMSSFFLQGCADGRAGNQRCRRDDACTTLQATSRPVRPIVGLS